MSEHTYMAAICGVEKGNFNPLRFAEEQSILQIFDTAVTQGGFEMTTNASSHKWTMQFNPNQVYEMIHSPLTLDITVQEDSVNDVQIEVCWITVLQQMAELYNKEK